MDPHSFIARAEAQRWLGIAEKLLVSHDLVGSKTFAIRARESDPRLEAADQILAIADTLLAAEKRVVGNNGNHQPDYSAILQLVRFVQDTDHIAQQYRRLAVALNPHQNRFPYADQAFQLVNDAWAVLSNPMRKSMYDSDLDYTPQQQMNTLGFNIEQQHHHHQQAHNFFSINQELPEQSHQQTFQSRLHQTHQHQQQQHQQQQLQQHNFLSQANPVRPMPVREQEHLFQHREQEQLFQVTSPPHQQTRLSPQGSQSQGHIQSPSATSQGAFSWPQMTQQQFQHQQIKQEHQHQQVKQEHHIKPEQHLHQQIKQEQQLKQQQMQQEQLRQQQLQEEQRKQQQLQEKQMKQQQMQLEQLRQQQEQRKLQSRMEKQQQLLEEQRKQQQLQEEQRKQQQLLEEQRKQQQMLEDQRKQQQLLEEQRKQQLLEEQRKQQQLLEEQRKQQQLLEEQRKQQQLEEEQRKQQQMLEEQRKQQQLLEEQRKQQQLEEEQRKQQQLEEERQKQQQLEEELRKQQQLQEEQQKQQQLQEEQRKQQQLQEEQRKQQEQQRQESVKHSAAPVQVNNNNGVRVEETEMEAEMEAMDDSPTFWTACPYCFYMYEYPKVYVECTLRCDNCKRAFQAVRISSPPPIIEGQDAYFYCWGFIPVGLSMSHLQNNNNKGRNSNWTPFSSLHNASNNFQNHLNEQAAPKENPFVNKSSGPRIYLDEITEDVFIGVSEPSSDSDTEWVSTKKQKSKRMDEGFKERIQVLALRAIYTENGSVKNLKHGIPVQKRVEMPAVLVVEAGKKNARGNPRKQSGRIAQELGKLDLNLEFNNNEGEETAPRKTASVRAHKQGEEGNIEGNEFFEGLDEYLSSLPILSAVNEEKVKVA